MTQECTYNPVQTITRPQDTLHNKLKHQGSPAQHVVQTTKPAVNISNRTGHGQQELCAQTDNLQKRCDTRIPSSELQNFRNSPMFRGRQAVERKGGWNAHPLMMCNAHPTSLTSARACNNAKPFIWYHQEQQHHMQMCVVKGG